MKRFLFNQFPASWILSVKFDLIEGKRPPFGYFCKKPYRFLRFIRQFEVIPNDRFAGHDGMKKRQDAAGCPD